MPRNSTQAPPSTPLGSSGMTSLPARTQPPRVQTSPNPHSPIHMSIPEVSIPAPASTAVPQEGISRPLANTGEDLVDHGLVNRLLALQPNMTLNQMTSVLNILHPNRHRNAAAAALRRAPLAPIRSPTPVVMPAPTTVPIARPLTGTQINDPQRRVPVASNRPQPESLLEILNRPSRKRSTLPSSIYPLSRIHQNLTYL